MQTNTSRFTITLPFYPYVNPNPIHNARFQHHRNLLSSSAPMSNLSLGLVVSSASLIDLYHLPLPCSCLATSDLDRHLQAHLLQSILQCLNTKELLLKCRSGHVTPPPNLAFGVSASYDCTTNHPKTQWLRISVICYSSCICGVH